MMTYRFGLIILLLLSTPAFAFNAAFFYGSPLPQELHIYDAIVVQPDQADFAQVSASLQHQLYAYASLGEASHDQSYFRDIPAAAKIARNSAWKNDVLDQASPAWRAFFLDKVVAPLWQRGFRGLFIDTMDSYQLAAATPQAKAAQVAGMVETLRQLHERFPGMRIILNRGFEVLPQVHQWVTAVAAESLYQGWNNVTHTYTPVAEADRQWLLTQLNRIKDNYHLPVVVIDYAAPKHRRQAREIAKKIHAAGFIPWVSDAELDMIGVGYPEIQPRRILMLYDGRENQDVIFSDAFQFAGMPLQYMGFIPEYKDLTKSLPTYQLAGEYAGIVLWSNRSQNDVPQLQPWLLKQIDQGMRVAVINEFGFERSNANLNPLGLTVKDSITADKVEILAKDPMLGFEHTIDSYPGTLDIISAGKNSTPILQLKVNGQVTDVAAYTSWGGYVLSPFAIYEIPYRQGTRWIINPFVFFRRALELPDMPVPDVTTSTGRRLLMAHMDGDGFASNAEFPGSPLCSRVMLEKIFKKYTIPTAVSVIEGETAPWGLYPKKSADMEQIAREMFRLPHVEIASHSWSHPFKWQQLGNGLTGEDYSLPIPGYTFNLTRETTGSVNYINQRLAPPGKTCRIFLWTGDCNPGADAIAKTDSLGLLNMNGGDTVITNSQPSLTLVAPLGIAREGHYQIYAPNQNENVYTNNWTGPFYGYRRVIETFKLTDAPRRLKPMDIYFHTYSASKPASLKALEEVFDWALKQPNHPVYPSEYIRRVMDFNQSVIAREGNDWLFYGDGAIDTLRIDPVVGYPAANDSIAGYKDFNAARYLHLIKSPVNRVTLTPQAAAAYPALIDANGALLTWQQQDRQTDMTFNSYVDLDFTLKQSNTCILYDDKGHTVHPFEHNQQIYHYQTHAAGRYSFHLRC